MPTVIPPLVLALAFLACGAPAAAQTLTVPAPCDGDPEQFPRLNLVSVQTGRLAPGESACLGVMLQGGEFIRISVDADAGFLRARILEPRRHTPLQVTWAWSFSRSLPLAIEAQESGLYVVELTVPTAVPFEDVPIYRVQMFDWLSAAEHAATLQKARSDPRAAWLRANAVPLHSIDPDDSDFSDLEFLREALRGVRVVLLGEGDHGGGSDVLAQTRLTKFLHQEMGFDVVAFESGLHSTAAAWRALQTDIDPREAVLKGVFGIWARSAQFESLIRYLSQSARGGRPLELVGFDSQLTGTAAATLLPELQEFLAERRITSPLTDEDAVPTRVLAGILDGRFARERETMPGFAEQAQAAESLRATASQVDQAVPDAAGAFWAQVLRSTAVQIDLLLNNLRGGTEIEYMRGRDRQMTDNLLWLADTRYHGRKIVVCADTFHTLRNPQALYRGRRDDVTMGHGLWEALGEQSFVIAFTSYDGTTHWVTQPEGWNQDIIPDQHPSIEFEELMYAAGHELAYVNLRRARTRGDWLGGRFLASALYLMPEEAQWSEAVDALFFIRTQEPRQPAR